MTMPKIMLRSGFRSSVVLAAAVAALALAGCSNKSGKTILALTIASPMDLGQVSRIEVSLTRSSGSPFNFAITDAPTRSNDAGNIDESFFRRIELPDGWSGSTMIAARAFNPANVEVAAGMQTSDIVEHEATAALIRLMKPSPPDGGTGGDDARGDAGSDGRDNDARDSDGRDAAGDADSDGGVLDVARLDVALGG